MRSRIILCMSIALLLTGVLFADTDFMGTVDEKWSNPDNWSNDLPHSDMKTKLVNQEVLCVLDTLGARTKQLQNHGHLRLMDGAEITTTNWHIIGYGGNDSGLLEIFGGVFNSGVRTFVGFGGSGTMVMDNFGVWNQKTQYFGIGWNNNAGGLVQLKGGELNCLEGCDHPPVELDHNGGENSQLDLSGGVVIMPYDAGDEAYYIQQRDEKGTLTAYDGAGSVVIERVVEDDSDQLVIRALHSLNPNPLDNGMVPPNGKITLSWTVDEGTLVDVWFTDDPEKILAGDPAAKLIDKQAMTSVQVTAGKGDWYYWAVDTYASDTEFPNYGPVFDFYVDNIPPVIDAGSDIRAWLTDGTVDVTLSGTVTDVDAITSTWSAIAYDANDPVSPNELLPIDANNVAPIVIANPGALDTTVRLNGVGTYVLQLDANDGEYDGEPDTMTIFVSADVCKAAQAKPDYEASIGDINGDCIVDEADKQILLDNWLKCNGLGCLDPNAQ